MCKWCKKIIEHPKSNSQKYHKECSIENRRDKGRENYSKNKNKPKFKEQRKKVQQKYNKKYKDELVKKNREYRKNNIEWFREWSRNYDEKNKIKRKKLWQNYYQKNKEDLKKKRKEYNQKNSSRIKAQTLASYYIKIPKNQICQNCNKNLAVDKHHPDYSKSLEVIFLCKKCHNGLHFLK